MTNQNKIYQVKWDDKAKKQLAKLGKQLAGEIYQAVLQDLSLDPYSKGKRLKGRLQGLFSYRYTRNYRVIYEVFENKILVVVLEVGHRKDIYD